MDKPVTKSQVKDIATAVMYQNYTSGSPLVPPHYHNGNDNLQVQEKYIIHNNKFLINSLFTPGTSDFTISNGIYNPSKVTFYGVALHAGGPVAEATINGTAEIGTCFQVESLLGKPVQTNIIQACTATGFEDNLGVPNPVSLVTNRLAEFVLPSSTVVFTLDVTSWTNTSVTFHLFLASGWQVVNSIIIT